MRVETSNPVESVVLLRDISHTAFRCVSFCFVSWGDDALSCIKVIFLVAQVASCTKKENFLLKIWRKIVFYLKIHLEHEISLFIRSTSKQV